MAAGFVLLHLSDIHFSKKSGGVYDLNADLRNEIERDILRLHARVTKIDAVLVTGDIAFSGKQEEYKHAKEWLERLCTLCDLREDAVFVTPGNHDVDREATKKSRSLQHLRHRLREESNELAAAMELDACLQDEDYRQQLFKPLKEYLAFAAYYGCEVSPSAPFWEKDLPLPDGSTLRLRGLNSVLISDDKDSDRAHKLLLGAAALVLPERDGITYLTMCHHPPDWLFDAQSLRDKLGARARIQLYGHRHLQRVHKHDNSLIVTAGAVHPDRGADWEPRYNLLRLAVESTRTGRSLKVTVWPRRFEATTQTFQADHNPDGNEHKEFTMELTPWTKSASADKIREYELVASTPGVPPAAPDAPNEAPGPRTAMTPLRRLTYRFLSLPFTSRLLVAQKLKLIEDSDEDLPDLERFQQVLQRAQQRGQLAALWDAVEGRHNDRVGMPNPFTTG